MDQARLVRKLEELQPGDHVCLLYESDDEHRAIVTGFLRQGLVQGEKVIYLEGEGGISAAEALDYLRQAGMEVEPYLAKGQFKVEAAAAMGLGKGEFNPEEMLDYLRRETEATLGEGYGALRVTGEMSWVWPEVSGAEEMLDYEARVNEFIRGSRCLVLCRYDLRRFAPGLVLEALRTHPVVVSGTEIYENFYYLEPEQILGPDRERAWVANRLANLKRHREVVAALRRERELKALILDNLSELLVFQDPEHRVLMANRAAAASVRSAPEELLGGYCYEIWHGRVRPCEGCPVVRVRETGERQEGVMASPNGRVWLIRGEPVRDEEGRLIGIVEVTQDITKQQRAEEAFRTLVTHSPFGIFIVQEGRFRMVNPGFEKITGYREEELVGRDSLDLVVPEWREEVRRQAIAMLKGESQTPYKFPFLTKDGKVRWAMESVIAINLWGEKASLGYFADITERQLLKQQLAQSQKMEAIGLLAGGVAHDFNNLLTAVMGHCDIMTLELKPDEPFMVHVREIMQAAERGQSLTQQLLAFGRKQILQPLVVNLNEIVREMKNMLQRLLGEDIELTAVLAPGLGTVKADPGQLEQIIMNLAVNARDAMPQGGKLTLETANVYLDEDYARTHAEVRPGFYVMLAMSDTGHGMDEATRSRIFEPFFTTKELGRGTGLGLATVYGIVKQSGGHIWVYSEVGQGTTFKIYLPRVEETGMAPVRKEVPVPVTLRGQETVLVVEDDEALKTVIARALRLYGYTVLEARHAGEALLLCERHREPIHLLLTDVVLPQLNGPQLAARLTVLHPEMQVLYMSGYTENAVVHHGILWAEVHFLQKPFKVQTLVRKVRQVLEGAPKTPAGGRPAP